MNVLKACLLGLLLLTPIQPAAAQDYDDVKIHVNRLSDRVIVLTEDSPMHNNIIAIASEKGIVVVDTAGSYIAAKKMRKRIAEEFGRSDFAYTINTHQHWDHARGNQVFADTVIIGHEKCIAAMRYDEAGRPARNERRESFLKQERERLAGLDPDSEEAKELRWRLAFSTRNHLSQKEGFVLTVPNLVFNDAMTMDLGDLTLKLVYFGNAHSGSDILIQVPEEGILLTGDLFLDRGWLPLFAGLRDLDVPRFIEVLDKLLIADDRIHTVIPGHEDLWTREKLVLWRDYIADLWDGVKAADAEGLGLEAMRERIPLKKECYYLTELGHDEAELKRFHEENMSDFLRQLKESASSIVERVLAEKGIDAAREKLIQLRTNKKDGGVLFDENDFNQLGYKLMGENRIEAAIMVFEQNVKSFPFSWNVHDSLGEAYMNAGKKDLAIKYYRKSIKLNPDNVNGKDILKRLEE